MYIEQLYTNCLAEAAYYIESEGEAAIIDPLRETEPYIELAEKRGAKIKYIFETHFHADFISGHIDLARKVGADIIYGPGAKANYDITVAEDGQKFPLGKVELEVLHTPGHTMESSTFLLRDENGKQHSIYTGDTLFINDVGRPDLAVKTDLTKEDLARHLYHSIHNKIMPLPDDVIVYPGHGAGSACGKNIGKETFDSLGHQKEVNYALQPMSEDDFVEAVVEGLTPPPAYFPKNAQMNKAGYESIDTVMKRNLEALSPAAVEAAMENGALLLDTRAPEDFSAGFIPGAINIGLNGQYAVWVGTLIPFNHEIVVVAEPGKEEEAIMRLARVGYEYVTGYVDGGVEGWKRSGRDLDAVENIDAAAVESALKDDNQKVVDVRRATEYAAGHLPGAQNLQLDYMMPELATLDQDKTYVVHCAGGYRSMIAASLLKRAGIRNVRNAQGGYNALAQDGRFEMETGAPTAANA